MLIPVSGGEPFREVMRFAGALVDMCRREMYNCLNTRDFGISMVRSVRDPMSVFRGSGVALVTPMKENGEVNYDSLEALLEDQIRNHTDAVISVGTSGEAPTLEDDEHLKVIKFTVDVVRGRIPVIAGTGSNNTAHAIMMSEEAEKLGADGLLLVTPYYNKATQDGLVEHYTAIASSTKLPCIVYNVPSRTGTTVQPETMIKIAKKNPNVCAIKEASGNFSAIAHLADLADGKIDIYSGK